MSKVPISILTFCRQFAKRTFLKTARKAGLKKQSRKPNKHSLTSPPVPRRGPGNHSPRSSDSESEYAGSIHQDDLSGMCQLLKYLFIFLLSVFKFTALNIFFRKSLETQVKINILSVCFRRYSSLDSLCFLSFCPK